MRICFCFVGENSSAKKLSSFPVCDRRNFFVKAITFPSSLSPPLVLSPARKSRSRGGTKSKNERTTCGKTNDEGIFGKLDLEIGNSGEIHQAK